jgi:hypothetical protein
MLVACVAAAFLAAIPSTYAADLSDSGTSNNVITSNEIGTDADDDLAIGNGTLDQPAAGVRLDVGTTGNTVGSEDASGENIIEDNNGGIDDLGTNNILNNDVGNNP